MVDLALLQAKSAVKAELLCLNRIIITLRARKDLPGTPTGAKADIALKINSLNQKYVDLFHVFEEARDGRLIIAPPGADLIKRIQLQSDGVDSAIKKDATTDAFLKLADGAVTLAAELYKV